MNSNKPKAQRLVLAGAALPPTTAADKVAPLDPAKLGPLAAQAEAALLRQGESDNTLRAYAAALRYWAAWFWLRYHRVIELPVSEATVRQYIVDHAQRIDPGGALVSDLPADIDASLVAYGFKGRLGPPALNTLLLRVSVLSKLHQDHQVSNPCHAPAVKELLVKTRRGYAKRGALPRKKAALTRDPLEALLATCDTSLVGLRDRALLLFAFSSGGRRRSEVVSASIENTQRVATGYLFTLTHSKTNQQGLDRPDNDKMIEGRAAEALTAWLKAACISSGALFRRVRRGNLVAEPLAAAGVYDIVKRRCLLAGVDGDFSAHSLRSGFVTESARQQIPLAETMAMTGHRSPSSLMGYFRQSPLASRANRLMDLHESTD